MFRTINQIRKETEKGLARLEILSELKSLYPEVSKEAIKLEFRMLTNINYICLCENIPFSIFTVCNFGFNLTPIFDTINFVNETYGNYAKISSGTYFQTEEFTNFWEEKWAVYND